MTEFTKTELETIISWYEWTVRAGAIDNRPGVKDLITKIRAMLALKSGEYQCNHYWSEPLLSVDNVPLVSCQICGVWRG